MKILFLGSSHFSKVVLQKILKNGQNVVAVITQPDKPSGRGHKLQPTEVKKFSLENNIAVYTFDKVRNHIEEIKNIDYDLAVVASFGQILPESFLEIKLTINVHPSLLPKYRGATPIQSAIINGDKETGVTIMKVAKEVDSGDIILQEKVEINDEYYLELEEKLAEIGGDLVCKAILQAEQGSMKFLQQDHSKATFVAKFFKEDGQIDFNSKGIDIINKVRALSEEVGTYFSVNQSIIKVFKAKVVDNIYNLLPNEVANNKKALIIGCIDGAVEIEEVLAPSGKRVGGRDYINGHNEILGEKVDNVIK